MTTIGNLIANLALADIRKRRQLAMFPELPARKNPPCCACDAGQHFNCSGELEDNGHEPCGCDCDEGKV